MPRRYLQVDEVAAALRRGKAVECFIGSCSNDAGPGIRWLALRLVHGEIRLSVFESRDEGSPDFLDIYGFGPLNADLAQGEPDELMMFSDLSECLASIARRSPGAPARLVNEGVVQDEYSAFIAQGRDPA